MGVVRVSDSLLQALKTISVFGVKRYLIFSVAAKRILLWNCRYSKMRGRVLSVVPCLGRWGSSLEVKQNISMLLDMLVRRALLLDEKMPLPRLERSAPETQSAILLKQRS